MRPCQLRVPVAVGFLVLMAFVHAGAATIQRHLDFTQPSVMGRGTTCLISIEGLPEFGDPGEPVLPSLPLHILLPQGEAIAGVSAVAAGEDEIELDWPPEWGQPQAPLSLWDQHHRVLADPAIYESNDPFPAARAVHVTTETYRGYNIAFLRVYPVRYVGAESKIVFASNITLTIETGPAQQALSRSQGSLRPGVGIDRAKVLSLVDEDDLLSSYRPVTDRAPLSALVDPAETYPMVIITNSMFEPAFQVLKEAKDQRGLRTRIVLISDIVWGYEGQDLQERIRKFIKDAYLFWETEYVLLGGDDEYIPHRGFYAEILPYVTDNDIPADLYYGALDGTWNDDGDGRWGEPAEADLLPEVSVARASVGSLTEATNFVNKVVRYETAPVTSQIKIAQMAGELVYDEPTWGGDEKDEIKDGSSAHGFTTVGFPPSYTVHTLYDRDLYPGEWTKWDLIDLLNSGRHLVNHAGHCINWLCMKISTSDIPGSFTNDGISNSYLVIYAHGCYSAAFDNRTTDGSYVGDAVAEYFTFIENGAVAYIGNTRYGCGFHGDTRSAAQYFDRQFFDAVFGEDITVIGDAFDDSKTDNIPYIDFRGMRWTYYTNTLIGDPSMDIWTDTPGVLAVSGPEVVHVGENEIEVTVTDGSLPIEGARVTVLTDSTFGSWGHTDGDGIARLDPAADTPGSCYVAVSAHNCYSRLDTVPVEDAATALVMIEGVTLDDDDSGASSGDSDGAVDAGETIEVVVALRNVGGTAAQGVSGVLRSSDPYVSVVDSSGTYANIPPGEVVHPVWSYVFEVLPSAPDSHEVAFELEAAYLDTSVGRHFDVTLSAPLLEVRGAAARDTLGGNGDGCLEAGETLELVLTLANRGSDGAAGIDVVIGEADPYAVVTADSAWVAQIPAGGEAETSPPYVITLTPECPEFHIIDLEVTIRRADGVEVTDSTWVYVGGSLEDDFETADPGWTHTELIPGFLDEWHMETHRNHTPGGAYSWKFGGTASQGYAHYGYAGLMTPELCLGSNASLTLWHWIQAELESGNYASDGGIVEISTDGGETWAQINPVGGYPHRIYPGTSTPIPPETPCFGWTDDWTQIEFDLAAYPGRARLRFTFGGGEHFGGEEGWYIDDVVVTDDYASVRVDEDLAGAVPARFALYPVSPNPTRGDIAVRFDVPRASRVLIQAFDIRGRRIERVTDSAFAPGRHSVTWKPSGHLAPGIYFIRMQAPDFDHTRKLIYRGH
jgi:hypothetical protein